MIINFQIDNKAYEIKELTVEDYYKIRNKILLEGYDAEFEVVSLLSGCPVEDIKSLKYEDWSELINSVNVLINRDFTLEDKFSPIVELEGKKYGFVNVDNLSVGEFADLDVILTSENAEYRLHESLAILYRPIISQEGDNYEIEKYDSNTFAYRANLFKKFPISKGRVAITFFLLSGNRSLKAMLGYLTTAMKGLKEDMPKDLQDQLNQTLTKLQEAGLELSLSSLQKTHSSWTARLGYTYGRLLTGLRGVSTRLKKNNSNSKKRDKNKNKI